MTEFCFPSRSGVLTVLLAAALAACAGASGKWTKANVTAEAMAVDVDECEFIVQAALSAYSRSDNTYFAVSSTVQLTKTQLPGTGAFGALSFLKQGDAFARCMEARGYKRTSMQ